MNNGFEEKMKRVEEIAELLEAEKTGIDDSIELFSEGAALIKELSRYLDEAERRVSDIVDGEEEND